MIAKQYKRGTRTGVERGKNGFGKGPRTGLERGKNGVGTGAKTGFKRYKKRNLTRFDNLERRGTAVLRPSTSLPGFFLPFHPFFHPFFDDFRQKREKRSSKNGGTGKERKAFFPVSFPFLFLPFPFQAHL